MAWCHFASSLKHSLAYDADLQLTCGISHLFGLDNRWVLIAVRIFALRNFFPLPPNVRSTTLNGYAMAHTAF